MHLRRDMSALDYRGGEYMANEYSGGPMTWMIQYAWGEGRYTCAKVHVMHSSMQLPVCKVKKNHYFQKLNEVSGKWGSGAVNVAQI